MGFGEHATERTTTSSGWRRNQTEKKTPRRSDGRRRFDSILSEAVWAKRTLMDEMFGKKKLIKEYFLFFTLNADYTVER